MEKSARLPWSASILIAAVTVLVSILIARAITDRTAPSLNGAIRLPCEPGQQVEILGNGLLYSDGAILHALNSDGRQIWSFTVGANAHFSVGEGGVAAWSDERLYLINRSDGSLYYNGTLSDVILSAKVGETYAAVLLGAERNASLLVLERGGRQVESIALSPEIVMDYGFFDNGNMLWVMKLNTEGTLPLSSVSTYNPGRWLAGSVTDVDQTVYQTFFQSETICSVGTIYARYYDYTGTEDESRRTLVYGWYLTCVGGTTENPLMVFAPLAQTDVTYAISDVRLIQNGVDTTIRMPFPCFALASSGSTVFGVHRDSVMLYTLGDAKPTTFASPVPIDRFLGLTEGRSLIVASGEDVYLIPVR